MSVDSEAVLREALRMPAPDRAEVAAELIASLDEPVLEAADTVRAVWAEELAHRARRAVFRADPGEPWPEVRDRARDKLAH